MPFGAPALCEIVRARQQKEFPWSSMVLDEFGLVAQAWQLQAESSAIIVQDKQGNVLFVKEGALNEADIQTVLGLIQQNL